MFCDSNMEAAATNLRLKLREHDPAFGMIGVGLKCLTVFAHQSAQWWEGKTFETFQGYPVEWRFDVGMPTANAVLREPIMQPNTHEIAEPTANLRFRLQRPSEGTGKMLEQLWTITVVHTIGEIISQRQEWRRVPMVSDENGD